MKQADLLIVNVIANTLRLGVGLLISFLVTPILLGQLGVELFGLLTTIGASGVLLTIFRGTLQESISRELAFSVGAADAQALSRAFSSAVYLQLLMSIVVTGCGLLVSRSIAEQLTVPAGYESATLFCLRLTFLQIGIAIAASPYIGAMQAHQDLRTLSLIRIAQQLSVLAAVLLTMLSQNKFVFFVTASFVIGLPITAAQVWIAIRRYRETRVSWSNVSRAHVSSIFRYGAFAFLSGIGWQLRTKGIAIFLNIVFGNAVAAANGVASRLAGLVRNFIGLIVPAIQPAMTTSTGAGKQRLTFRLASLASTISLAVAIPVAVPLLVDTESLLMVWLGNNLPPFAVIFGRLLILSLTFSLISRGHGLALQADGGIGVMVMVSQLVMIMAICGTAYMAYSLGRDPWLLYIGELIGVVLTAGVFRPLWTSYKLDIPLSYWFRQTLVPSGLVVLSCTAAAFLLCLVLTPSVLRAAILFGVCSVISVLITWLFSFSTDERDRIAESLRKIHRRLTSGTVPP